MMPKVYTSLMIICLLLFSFNANSQWKEYTAEVETGLIKGGNRTDKFCEDKSGNLWMGSRKGSLVKYKDGKFQIFDAEKITIAAQTNVGEIANAKKGSFVDWLIKNDNKNDWVWFASNRTTFLWDGNKLMEMTGHLTDENRMIFYSADEDANYIIKENQVVKHADGDVKKPTKAIIQISSLTVDSKNRVWLGSWKGSLFCLDKGIWNVYNDIKETESEKMKENRTWGINSIYENKDGSFWVLTNSYIAKYKDNKLKVEKSVEGAKSVYHDSKNNFWFSYKGGISRLSNGEWQSFEEKKDLKLAIPEGGKFFETQNGDFYFFAYPKTFNLKFSGLYKYNSDSWEYISVSKKNILTDVYEDSKGNLWCTDIEAVYKLENNEWKNLKKSKSVLKAAYFSIFEDSKGDMWFGMGSFKGRVEKYIQE